MQHNRFTELLSKKRSGNITLAEQRELSALLQNDPASRLIANSIDDLLESPLKYSVSPELVNNALQKFHKERNKTQLHVIKPSYLRKIWGRVAVAASLLLLLGASYLFYNRVDPGEASAENIVATKTGSRSSVTLPDGTKVWINSDTRLTYPESFGQTSREVSLEGEAYFDVVSNPEKPFIVRTKTIDVRVLGTVFNIRAYDNEKNTEATLLHGVVEVFLKNKNNEKISLNPNDKIIVDNKKSEIPVDKISQDDPVAQLQILLTKVVPSSIDSTIVETQWVQNRLRFDQETLGDILPMLERWYGVKIFLKNQKLLERRFSGIFEDENINEVLETLKYSIGFNYTIENNKVTIF